MIKSGIISSGPRIFPQVVRKILARNFLWVESSPADVTDWFVTLTMYTQQWWIAPTKDFFLLLVFDGWVPSMKTPWEPYDQIFFFAGKLY